MNTLREAWEAEARAFAQWARKPGHDSYWRYHREQFFALLPPPGRLTLDVGCGEGRVSRDLKARGHAVEGCDGSATMIELAREADPSIPAQVADAAALPFASGSADLVVSFMVLHDVDDLEGAVKEAARVLSPRGRYCVAIVHPINSAGHFATEELESPFVMEGSYLEEHRTKDTAERDGLSVTFHSMHRPLESYFRAFAAAGFVVETLREPTATEGSFSSEAGRRWLRMPLFLHLRAFVP
jgi:SAM-dependent methyltransferase